MRIPIRIFFYIDCQLWQLSIFKNKFEDSVILNASTVARYLDKTALFSYFWISLLNFFSKFCGNKNMQSL